MWITPINLSRVKHGHLLAETFERLNNRLRIFPEIMLSSSDYADWTLAENKDSLSSLLNYAISYINAFKRNNALPSQTGPVLELVL